MNFRREPPFEAITLLAVVLILPWLAGCTAVSLNCFHVVGAPYCHESTCVIEDSPTNRMAVVDIVNSVGKQHGLSDRTKQWREEMSRFSAPLRHDTNDEVISFTVANSNAEATGIRVQSYKWEGKLLIEMIQVRWSKKRCASYIAIHGDLVAEVRRRFGESVSFREVDHLVL